MLGTFVTTYKLKTLRKGAVVREWPKDFSIWKEDQTVLEGYTIVETFTDAPSDQEVNEIMEKVSCCNGCQ